MTVRYTSQPGALREAIFEGVPSGRTPGTVTLEVLDASTAAVYRAASSTGIVELPTGTGISTYAIAYTAPTTGGLWLERWRDTVPTPDVVVDDELEVASGPLAGVGLTLEELKRRLDHQMDLKDDLLADDLAAAFLQAQAPAPYGTGRVLAPDPVDDGDTPVTRRILSTRRHIRVPDAREITAVTLDGTALATTSYEPLSKNGLVVALDIADDSSWTARAPWDCYQEGEAFVRRVVTITGRFGFATLPEDLAGAIYVLAARWHYERQAAYADRVESLEGTAVQSYYRQLPPRVKLTFARYAVPPAVGGLR